MCGQAGRRKEESEVGLLPLNVAIRVALVSKDNVIPVLREAASNKGLKPLVRRFLFRVSWKQRLYSCICCRTMH